MLFVHRDAQHKGSRRLGKTESRDSTLLLKHPPNTAKHCHTGDPGLTRVFGVCPRHVETIPGPPSDILVFMQSEDLGDKSPRQVKENHFRQGEQSI